MTNKELLEECLFEFWQYKTFPYKTEQEREYLFNNYRELKQQILDKMEGK